MKDPRLNTSETESEMQSPMIKKHEEEDSHGVSGGADMMSPFQTFAALCKGYCAINILILPKQF
jgi:hypothetical protein